MSWVESLYHGLKSHGIRLVCQVPDIVLADLISRLEQDPEVRVVQLTREEEGMGILSGAYMGGTRGALLMQSSGLGNSINALTSLCIPQQLPFLMVINPRGELGERNPFQLPMGKVLRPMLELMGIQHATLSREEEVGPLLDRACRTAFRANLPAALILSEELTGGTEL
ncbi:MAG TPA: thiamine pyrophosphate-binding protein [Chloroflexota bacterium]|nr:thiamine pyrophosphate-binding protein [Chloroflexota bacterium]